MEVITDFPERLHEGMTVFIGADHQPGNIISIRPHQKGRLIRLDNCEDAQSAGKFRNQYVYVSSTDLPPLAEWEYYHHQLLGVRVTTEEGQYLGIIEKILNTGANDVFILRSDSGNEILIPAIESVLKEIDIENGEMKIHLLPGLIQD